MINQIHFNTLSDGLYPVEGGGRVYSGCNWMKLFCLLVDRPINGGAYKWRNL